MGPMKKSINAWSVADNTTFEEVFAKISMAGFDGIELNVDAPGRSAHSLGMDTNEGQLSEISELSIKYQLPVVSISSSLFGGMVGSNDAALRAKAQEILKKQLEMAAFLGVDGILVVPGGALGGDDSLKQGYENSFKTISEMEDVINSHKINVCLENVWNGFFTSPFDMANFIDSFNNKYIKAYYDVGNVIAFSHSQDWIDVLGERINKVHIKDFKRNTGLNSGGVFCDLLDGDVDWKRVMPALAKAGFDGYLTAEVFPVKTYENHDDFYHEVSACEDSILGIL